MNSTRRSTLAAAEWSAFASAVVVLVPGLLALATSQILLFPSLGPTAVMMARNPSHRSSTPYDAIVGHFIGLGAAILAVAILHLSGTPSVFDVHGVSAARVAAAVLAIALAAGLEVLLHATHPPAASTTLLAALGSFHRTIHDAAIVVIGILVTVGAAEPLRRYRLRAQAESRS